jgi:hypothetical protein
MSANICRAMHEAKTGTLIVAKDGDTIVGASTALGLDEESDYVQQAV